MPNGRERTGNKAKKNKTSFKPGQSGNPSGCSKMPQGLKELALRHSMPALMQVIEISQDPNASNKDKLKALDMIMDRAEGKAMQGMEISGPEGNAINITLEGTLEDWAK